jgi:predicted enzyme related to lactoylglutathione lyase
VRGTGTIDRPTTAGSDHARFRHPGNQDRAAPRVRPGDGQGGVHALLGVPPQADDPHYVGFEAAGQHIGLLPHGGPQGLTSALSYWHVPDIEAKPAEGTAAGATVKDPVHDVGGGRLVATLVDPDGNLLGLLQDR